MPPISSPRVDVGSGGSVGGAVLDGTRSGRLGPSRRLGSGYRSTNSLYHSHVLSANTTGWDINYVDGRGLITVVESGTMVTMVIWGCHGVTLGRVCNGGARGGTLLRGTITQ